jgi:hypothetical protein
MSGSPGGGFLSLRFRRGSEAEKGVPLKTVLTVRKYELMGMAIMAKLKARSL